MPKISTARSYKLVGLKKYTKKATSCACGREIGDARHGIANRCVRPVDGSKRI
jgi:hypothetical protein